ncbi:hypothetical protein ACS0TY_029236 [Phlomoides rotata]
MVESPMTLNSNEGSDDDDWSLTAVVHPILKQKVESPVTLNTNEGSKSPMDDLFGLGQSPEGCMNSHPEEPNMVCVETSTVKRDINFSPQSFTHDGHSTELMTQAEHDDSKVSGVCLTDLFTAEQIKVHLCSLNPSLISINAGKLRGKMTAPNVGENTCQLCVEEGLTFAAPAISCASCGARILHNSTYYWSEDGMGARYCFCTKCFKGSRRGIISFNEHSVLKATLNKDKNTEDSSEAWVQCDKCEQWQHQICALYNSEQDIKGTVKYTCPFCRLKEIEEANIHVPPAFGARDLRRTKLSDHIEHRLFRSLEQDRKLRAEILGKQPEEVLGASGLSVRVVLSINKQLKVNRQFLDILPKESYPTEFPYKSKVILLFQKIEGVDVCLFAMYVQEFGSECSNPNKRSVYISYLDSVKYFRPDAKTSTGVALRTFVYHELLIGYLEYCKNHGFATCYIWACPSLRGDDYILNCHPENQKRPNSNKLVQWYKKMIKKAKAENIVVGSTNIYDRFFVPSGESNSKITTARLPYFDGDYLSGAIEDIIQTIGKNGGHQMTKRTFKAMARNSDLSKDILVMEKLGQRILNVKEEIMVVQLHFKCTMCNEAIVSGGYWSCNQCSKLHICVRCVEFEQFPSGMEVHIDIHGEKHPLSLIPMKATDDVEIEDGVLHNNIFDDRHSFLGLCEKNYYQFDSLRRAKHSSMMILHHLHTPTLAR